MLTQVKNPIAVLFSLSELSRNGLEWEQEIIRSYANKINELIRLSEDYIRPTGLSMELAGQFLFYAPGNLPEKLITGASDLRSDISLAAHEHYFNNDKPAVKLMEADIKKKLESLNYEKVKEFSNDNRKYEEKRNVIMEPSEHVKEVAEQYKVDAYLLGDTFLYAVVMTDCLLLQAWAAEAEGAIKEDVNFSVLDAIKEKQSYAWGIVVACCADYIRSQEKQPRRSYRQYAVNLGENLLLPSIDGFTEAFRSYNGENEAAYVEILPDSIASTLIGALKDNAENGYITFSEGSYIQVKKQANGSIEKEEIGKYPDPEKGEKKIVTRLSDYNEKLLEKVYTCFVNILLDAYKKGVDIQTIDPFVKMDIPAPILISNEATRTRGVSKEAIGRAEADLQKLDRLFGYTENSRGGHNTLKVLNYMGMDNNIFHISAPYIIKLIQLIFEHSEADNINIDNTHTALLKLSYVNISDEVIAEIVRKLCIQTQQAGGHLRKDGKAEIQRTLKSLAEEIPELAAKIEGEASEKLKEMLKSKPELADDHDFQEQVKRSKEDNAKKFLQRLPGNITRNIDDCTFMKERYKNLKVEITFGTGKEKTITRNNWQTAKIVITHSGTIAANKEKRAAEIQRAREHARRKHDNKVADKELEAALKQKKDEKNS